MATNVTAYDMVQWYWDIPVEGDANVSINKYLINHASTALTTNRPTSRISTRRRSCANCPRE
jgi:hypothetical protein